MWRNLIIAAGLAGVGFGCGNPAMPRVVPGMTAGQVDAEVANRWPPCVLDGVSMDSATGTLRRVFVQRGGYTSSYIIVDERDSVVERVRYVGQ